MNYMLHIKILVKYNGAILSTIVAIVVFMVVYNEYKEKYTYYYKDGEYVGYEADSKVFPQCEHSYERRAVSSYRTKWVPRFGYCICYRGL